MAGMAGRLVRASRWRGSQPVRVPAQALAADDASPDLLPDHQPRRRSFLPSDLTHERQHSGMSIERLV